jgi:hypothetical protein
MIAGLRAPNRPDHMPAGRPRAQTRSDAQARRCPGASRHPWAPTPPRAILSGIAAQFPGQTGRLGPFPSCIPGTAARLSLFTFCHRR